MTSKPTFAIMHAQERGDRKFWSKIGAAWPTKSGDGYRLQLDYIPTTGGDIYLLPWDDKTTSDNPERIDPR